MTLIEVLKYLSLAGGLFFLLTMVAAYLTLMERKVLARIQQRMGPTYVGFKGILQPLADAIKLITKEDLLPSWADRSIYWLAPIAVLVPAVLMWVTIPVTGELVLSNFDMGLLYITAISVLSVMGLVMAGWGSANKWAVMGGLRAAGQLVSYEIPFIMSILAIAMLAQSLNLREIVFQQNHFAFILKQPLAFFIFFTAGLAELGRIPFDIHHAESEVVGGPFVEYSGAHWAVFYLSEYMNTFTVAVLTTLLFLGGWIWPTMPFDGTLHNLLSLILFMFKTILVIYLIFWIRGTFPRLRIDQLMAFGWKILVPLSFINILITSSILFFADRNPAFSPISHWIMSLTSLMLLVFTVYLIKYRANANGDVDSVRLVSASEIRQNILKKNEVTH